MLTPFWQKKVILLFILIVAIFLRFYKLPTLMIFNGDVARDFLAARDISLKGIVPLLGSSSSVPWLNQGAFFTYLLGIVLYAARYQPVAGAYFTASLGILSVFLIYKLGTIWFSEKAGLLAAFFYATSPLVVIFDRFPYHQSLISLFTMLFFLSLYLSFKNLNYLVIASFLFGLLMQLELSNLVLILVLLFVFLEQRKKIYLKTLLPSLLFFLVTWLPKIIYDFSNNFVQTIGFLAWIIHKIPPVSIFLQEPGLKLPMAERFIKIFQSLSRIIFWPSNVFSTIIFLVMFWLILKKISFKEGKKQISLTLLIVWIVVPIVGFIIHGSPSESYMPVFFAVPALMIGFLTTLKKKIFGYLLTMLVFLLGIVNSSYLISHDYFLLTGNNQKLSESYNFGISYESYREIAKFIVKDASGKKYNILPLGNFGHFPSTRLNLVYLAWYLGNEPEESPQPLRYIIYNRFEGLHVRGAEWNKDFSYLSVAKQIKQ